MDRELAPGSWLKEAKKNAKWLILLGVIEAVVGVLALGVPLATGLAVTILVGVFITVGGIARIIAAFKAQGWGVGILGFLSGILGVVGGVLLVMYPMMGLLSITMILAFYFLFEGISKIILAFKLKGAKGWVWTVFSGIVTILLGAMIGWEWPLSGNWAVGMLAGVHLIMSGMSLIALGSGTRTAVAEIEEEIAEGTSEVAP